MSAPLEQPEFQERAQQIERLVQCVQALTDEDARTTALDLLQTLMDLHGAVMSRIVEVLAGSGEAGRAALSKLGNDPLICGLLVLYGVHPVPLAERVAQAIEKVAPQLSKQGANVELIGVADSLVRAKINASGHGCGSSPDALKSTVERAILEAAPEVAEIVVEGGPSSASGFVPLNMIQPAMNKEKNYEESTA